HLGWTLDVQFDNSPKEVPSKSAQLNARSAQSCVGTCRALRSGMAKSNLHSTPRVGIIQLSVADCIERVLVEHGIDVAATIPGGPLMPLLRTFHEKGRIRCVITRHESSAAMCGEGYYRVARRPSVVAV